MPSVQTDTSQGNRMTTNTTDPRAFELPAVDRIAAIETASRMAAVGYDALPQWAAYEVAA